MMPWGLRWIDVAVAKYGRKYSIALFAGLAAFVATILAMWIVARTSTATGDIVKDILAAYLLSTTALVGAYTTGNTMVERAHAGQPKPPRTSGSVREDA